MGVHYVQQFTMLYFSQLVNTKVRDSADVTVGRLKDIMIQPSVGTYAPLLFLFVIGSKKQELYIPFTHVSNISPSEITLNKVASNIPTKKPIGHFVYLDKDLVDEQIVDVDGARVVRVNDLKLGVFNDEDCLLGIDVGFKAILRRLGLAWLVGDAFQSQLIDWRKAQQVKGALQVDTLSDDLIRLHPADLANIIEDLSTKHGARLVTSLDEDTAAQVLEELDPRLQKIMIGRLGPEKTANILEKMSTDEVTDLIKMLPVKQAEEVLKVLPGVKLDNVEKLLHYKDDTAGGLMTTDMIRAEPNWTVKQTMEEIKQHSKTMRSLLYVYVVDEKNTFMGAISMRRLLLAEPKQKIGTLVPNDHPMAALLVQHSIRDIVRIMTKYDLYTAAVLDPENKLLGMVTIDDVMRHLHPEA